MNPVTFTISIPAYKRQFLKECIESILSQTCQDFEIVIVDDHSPQHLEDIISKYSNDPRIRYYKNEIGFGGKNVVGNWNKCLEYAKGEFIICMGDDDMLSPSCLANYLTLIQKYPKLNIYHTRTTIIDENSNPIDIQEARPEQESVYSMIWHLWKGRRQFIGDWLFRTSELRKRGGFYSLPYAWEADHICAFAAAIDTGVANCREVGFLYRENRNCITKRTDNTEDKIQAIHQAKTWYINFLKVQPADKTDVLYRKLLIKDIHTHFHKRLASDLSEAIKHHPTSILHWVLNMKKMGISLKILMRACALAISK
jgi:glycosyltransferase involved in cell wall biosynthesis